MGKIAMVKRDKSRTILQQLDSMQSSGATGVLLLLNTQGGAKHIDVEAALSTLLIHLK